MCLFEISENGSISLICTAVFRKPSLIIKAVMVPTVAVLLKKNG